MKAQLLKSRKNSKLSKEDVEALDCLDDEDPKILPWNFVRRFAETDIINELISKQIPISFKISATTFLFSSVDSATAFIFSAFFIYKRPFN